MGDHVKQGQLIAEIDPSPFEKKVEIAGAQLDNLKAQLLQQGRTTDAEEAQCRAAEIPPSPHAASRRRPSHQANADLLMAEAEVKALNAQIRQQEAQLASDKVDLGYTSIYSPMGRHGR